MISSARDSIASAIFNRARWRSDGVESRHSVNALAAAVIALSTSAALEFGAVAKAWPVAGLIRVVVAPEVESTNLPFTKFCNFFIVSSYLSLREPIDHRDLLDDLCSRLTI